MVDARHKKWSKIRQNVWTILFIFQFGVNVDSNCGQIGDRETVCDSFESLSYSLRHVEVESAKVGLGTKT